MGLPVSAVMTNFSGYGKPGATSFVPTSLVQPRFWKRYVDNVCAAVKSGLVKTLQDHLNSVEPSIQLTVEREANQEIAFLDVSVCRQDNGQLASKVYRKPTRKERYLSFESHHPIAHKKAVVKWLTNRANNIPTTSDIRSTELKQVTWSSKRVC